MSYGIADMLTELSIKELKDLKLFIDDLIREKREDKEGEGPYKCEHSFIDVDNNGVYGEEICRRCGFKQKK